MTGRDVALPPELPRELLEDLNHFGGSTTTAVDAAVDELLAHRESGLVRVYAGLCTDRSRGEVTPALLSALLAEPRGPASRPARYARILPR